MNRVKLLRLLFILFIVLTVIFGIGLIVPGNKGEVHDKIEVLGRIGLWCGFIACFLNAVIIYTEIRKNK